MRTSLPGEGGALSEIPFSVTDPNYATARLSQRVSLQALNDMVADRDRGAVKGFFDPPTDPPNV